MLVSLPYHEGELEFQARAGEFDRAVLTASAIRSWFPPPVVGFFRDQRWVVIGGRDVSGAVWVTVLFGQPGFLTVQSETVLRIAARPMVDDPLALLRSTAAPVGLLAIDLGRRRRVRVNGQATPLTDGDGGLLLTADQVYPNCMKYIQRRELVDVDHGQGRGPERRGGELTAAQQDWLATTDTFYLASAAPDGSADASHRGGTPGFLEVPDANSLLWPDYAGNSMFNTLGNVYLDPRVGLLALDPHTGSTLHLTGRCRVENDPPLLAPYPGARRLVLLQIEEVREYPHRVPLRFGPPEVSPFNPPSRLPAPDRHT